jgi:hypothetical protein
MYDPIKEFIKNFHSSDIPHELKKRAYARSPSELRKFKDKTAAARKLQHEKRAKRQAAYFASTIKGFKKSTSGALGF